MRCTQTELKRTKATTRRIVKGWWRCTIKIVSSSRIYTVDDAHAVVGRETCEATDLDGTIRFARFLHDQSQCVAGLKVDHR